MRSTKIFNNSAVAVITPSGQEAIALGNGIGFRKRPGDEIDDSKIQKVYYVQDVMQRKFLQMLKDVQPRVMDAAERIIAMAEENGCTMSSQATISLIDHISFAIERQRKGLDLTNALLWEIRKFYPDEFQLGLDALDDEAGFLAMHIVNAQYGSGERLANDLVQLIRDVVNLVRYTYNLDLNEDSLDYIRFVTHLKFFLSRIFTRETYSGSEELYNIVSAMYPKAEACTQKIATYIHQKLGYSLDLEEQGYLIIHIEKLTRT